MLKILYWLENGVRNRIHRFRGILLKIYLNIHGCKVGTNLKCKRWPNFRWIPYRNITIGNDVNLGYNITFDINKNARLTLGNHVDLPQDVILSAAKEIYIGNFSGVGEHSTVRDNNHTIKKGEYYMQQEIASMPVYLGDDVWIGSGCYVLKGAKIPDGCVVAANSVVVEKSVLEANGIYAGNPVVFKNRRV